MADLRFCYVCHPSHGGGLKTEGHCCRLNSMVQFHCGSNGHRCRLWNLRSLLGIKASRYICALLVFAFGQGFARRKKFVVVVFLLSLGFGICNVGDRTME